MRNDPTRIELGAALAMLVAWAVWATLRDAGQWSIDLSAIYLAARFVDLGQPLLVYGPDTAPFGGLPPDGWGKELANLGVTDRRGVHFVYPPIWAHLLAPLAGSLDPITFFNGGRALVISALAGSVLLTWRVMRPAIPLVAFVPIAIIFLQTTMPGVSAIGLAQPQLIVIFLTLLAFDRYLNERDIQAGVALGLAAAIKITPILFCVIFLADRRFRAAGVAALVSGGIAVTSFAVAGIDLHLAFLSRVSEVAAIIPFDGLNITFETVMHDFFVPITPCDYCMNRNNGMSTPWVSGASNVLMLASIGLSLWLPRRWPEPERARMRLFLLSLGTTFFSPLAWLHYYTLPTLLFLGFIGRLPTRSFAILTALVWLPISLPVMGMLVKNDIGSMGGAGLDTQHVGLVSLVAMVAVAVVLLSDPAAESSNQTSKTVPQSG